MAYKSLFIVAAFLIIQGCHHTHGDNPMTLDDLNQKTTDPDQKKGGLFSGRKGYFEITPDDLK